MKAVPKTILSLSILSSIILINGCSSHSEVISVSEVHPYNSSFGLNNDFEVDNIIQNELKVINMPTEIEQPKISNPEWTTDASVASNTFLAEEYVQSEPIITYKYKFDKKFYDTAEWRKEEYK
jgi:PBP1b-binding outer membrane lipoprotein LpoB